MNAGGMSKACKLNELNFFGKLVSGKRESNTLVTYLELANSPWKRGLIRDTMGRLRSFPLKDLSVREGPMFYQLVGEVKAHQGYDGYRA